MSSALIIDSSYLIFRSYFAYPHLNSGDRPTGAFYGFAKAVIKMIKDHKPDLVYFAKDLPTPTWRHSVYSEYKGGRKEVEENMVRQIPVIHNWSDLIGSACLASEGFEADDIINTLAVELNGDTNIERILIFSADRDLYQIFDCQKVAFVNGDKIFDRLNFEEKYGVKSSQWVDYKALVGDSSDNLPGVDKIGPKTAVSILQALGDLTELLAYTSNPDSITNTVAAWLENPKNLLLMEKIQKDIHKLTMNRQLSQLQIVPDITITKKSYDLSAGRGLFEEYGFNSLLNDSQNAQGPVSRKKVLSKELTAQKPQKNATSELF